MTFLFMLRWQFVPLLIGVLLVVLSAYGILTFQGDAPDAAYSSLAGMIGRPLSWFSLVFGLGAIVYAWYKAAQLRNGS